MGLVILTWIRSNWKMAALLLTLMLAGLSGWKFRSLIAEQEINRLVIAKELEKNKALSELQSKCNEAKKITEEVTNDYEAELSSISTKLAAARSRLRIAENAKCVPIASAASVNNATAARNGLPRENGVLAESLLNMAAVCDQQTAKLKSCQSFVEKVYQLNGQ